MIGYSEVFARSVGLLWIGREELGPRSKEDRRDRQGAILEKKLRRASCYNCPTGALFRESSRFISSFPGRADKPFRASVEMEHIVATFTS